MYIVFRRFWSNFTGLPVWRRVECKLVVLVFNSLRGQAPPYLAEECQFITNDPERCHFRSADTNVCTVPRTSTRLGDISFSVAGPWVWNSLPNVLRLRQLDMDFGQFKQLLKTSFVCLRPRHTCDCFRCATYKFIHLLTYLFTYIHAQIIYVYRLMWYNR